MKEIKMKLNNIRDSKLEYLVHLPDNYYDNGNEEWPLILFLHGAGERGNNINDIKKYGIHRYIKSKDIPFIVVSPQCPKDNFWDMHIKDLILLLEEIKAKHIVNNRRIYLIGISMGAVCAWNFSIQFPNIFSAIVPIAGGASFPNYADRIKDIPTWSLHGKKDEVVPVEKSREIVERLREIGANIKYTEVSDSGHELCTTAFEKEDIFSWLLEYER